MLATRPDPEPPVSRELLAQVAGHPGLDLIRLEPLSERDGRG